MCHDCSSRRRHICFRCPIFRFFQLIGLTLHAANAAVVLHLKMSLRKMKIGVRLKIIVGYAVLAAVLIVSTWMMYADTRTLSEMNVVTRQLMERRNLTDSLVCSLLQASNAERSVCLGDASEWQRFCSTLSHASAVVQRLKQVSADSAKSRRLDSLTVLLDAKRTNTLAVMAQMGADVRGESYDNKVDALRSGRDSVVIHPTTAVAARERSTVYEIVRTRKGFFRRLADAFRRQRSDTLSNVMTSAADSSATRRGNINIADSVADALVQINGMEQRERLRRSEAVAGRNKRLQWVSVQLAGRTSALLADIQADEHTALARVVEKSAQSRRNTIQRIGVLGLCAIAAAVLLLVNILRDIRRERRRRRCILEAKAQAEKLMQQREQLLLTITHDIKAPAASIAGFIDLLAEKVLGGKAASYLDSMRGSARHLLRLVAALLDYHRLERGDAERHDVSFSPVALIAECVGAMQPIAAGRHIVLSQQVDAGMQGVVCRADAFRIRQILANLVDNALKYTDEGGVVVRAALSEGAFCFSVSDTGIGMTDEEQQRIFAPFGRLAGAQGREGVGLGLSITRGMVELLGGQISVESSKGRGSKFTVSVPVQPVRGGSVPPANAAVAAASGSRQCAPLYSCGGTVRIVAVDDDSLQLQLLREMLGKLSGTTFDAVFTQSAAEAVQLVRTHRPHILFTDVEMPEMDGAELLRRISGSGVKVVAMTAHDTGMANSLRKLGFDDCLFKPFNAKALAATVDRLTMLGVKCADADYFSALTSYADGDAEAERQIMDEFSRSVNSYMETLETASAPADVARVAHKAMPMLAMLHRNSCSWLVPITPEHIAGTAPADIEKTVARLLDELRGIRQRLDARGVAK